MSIIKEITKPELIAWIGYILFVVLGFTIFISISLYAKHKNYTCMHDKEMRDKILPPDKVRLGKGIFVNNEDLDDVLAVKQQATVNNPPKNNAPKKPKQKESFGVFNMRW